MFFNWFSWNRVYIVRAQSNLKLKNLTDVKIKFDQKFLKYYSQLDEENIFKINQKNLNNELVRDFNRLVHDTNKEQAQMLRESFKNCNVSKLVDEWWETNLPIYVENFLSSNEEILRRWYDYLDLTSPLKQDFNSYEELREALSSNVGNDEWVSLAKDSLSMLLVSPEGSLSTVMQKFMSDNSKLVNKILEFLNLFNSSNGNKLNESLLKFDNLLTNTSKINLNDVSSASDVKSTLSEFVTEKFENQLQGYLTFLDTQSRDAMNLTIEPIWYDGAGTEVVQIDILSPMTW